MPDGHKATIFGCPGLAAPFLPNRTSCTTPAAPPGQEISACSTKHGGAYSNPMEMRDTATTSKSRMLNEFLQKEPLCRKAPYAVIWRAEGISRARQGSGQCPSAAPGRQGAGSFLQLHGLCAAHTLALKPGRQLAAAGILCIALAGSKNSSSHSANWRRVHVLQ